MDSSRGVNNTNGESNERETTNEENQTPTNQQDASQSHPSQFQPNNTHRSLRERLSRLPSVADLKTLESSFRSLSVVDSTVPHQTPFLENPWTNGSSSEINGGAGDGVRVGVHRSLYNGYRGTWDDSINTTRNNGAFLNGNSQGAFPYSSRNRHNWDSDNEFGPWGSGYDPSPFYRNPRMRSIASLAKDPNSSAELQRKISEGSKETIDVVFEGVIFHVCDLMVDPYGHHVLRKLMERCSSEQITQIIDVITQLQLQFVGICTDPVGALSVKSLLRYCLRSEEQISRIVRAITGSLGELAFTRSGNSLVILQCFKLFQPSHTRDLLEVIAQNCLQIATDEYGCRMLQQCLDTGCNVVKQRLIKEIIANALRLCVNSFGNYVVQYLLELGDPNVTLLLLRQLSGNYAYLARNKFASHVVQKLLNVVYINPSTIVHDLLRDIDTLVLDPFGNYVIQTALLVCKGELRMILLRHIDRNKPLMRCNMYGNKILKRFNL
ncbi:hypothetical protein N665_0433s0004 [Sinapis alba]|nr:hypothetical protein N665_0433s0004 [Sinapis alba]